MGTLSPQVLEPNPGNPRGHWESLEALNLNRDFMSRLGSSWHDPSFRMQTDPTIPPKTLEEYETAIRGFLETSFEMTDTFVVKDPRISAIAPTWLRAADQVGCETRIVHMFRRLEGVAQSLASRDNVKPALSKALWLKYHLLCERDCRHRNRVFVEFPNFLLEWRERLPWIFSQLQARVRLTSASAAAIEEFVDNARSSEPPPKTEQDLTDRWVDTIYQWMRNAANGENPNHSVIDRCYLDVTSTENMYRNSFSEYWANKNRWQ